MDEDYDANNLYGSDSAYADNSLYSLGSAQAITVNSSIRGIAEFSFYGTGFDIVGLTDSTTGTLIVQVFDANGSAVKTSVIDTYYGYAYVDGEWITVDSNSPNAIYQVPVMKISGLTYGQYSVKLTAGYNSSFDHTSDEVDDNGNSVEAYTLYIDAIRIYDPANDGKTDEAVENAYLADGEAYPEYTELRDKIITADTFNSLNETAIASGIVFIDGATTDPDKTVSIADYTAYGPNNEVYLQYGNAVAFDLNATATAGEVASVQLAIKSVGGTGDVEVYGIDGNANKTACLAETISTATDMYYDITALNGQTVVIKNAGDADDATISLTNIKTTYTAEQTTTEEDGTEAASYSLLSVRRSTADAAVTSLSVDDEGTGNGSDDEITEETPDDTVEDSTEDNLVTTITTVIETIINQISSWFSKWFK